MEAISGRVKTLKCRACGSSSTTLFLERAGVPVHQNLLCFSIVSAENVDRGDLSLVMCDDCGFSFNKAFDEKLLSYGDRYDNRQTYSPVFKEYLEGLVSRLIEEWHVANSTVVEVGCGDGYFLKRLCMEGNNRGVGFDPSYEGPSVLMDGRLTFRRDYWGPDIVDVQANVVICRHVIEHVPDPIVLLNAVRLALSDSREGRLFLETHSLEWIIENRVFWDLFYEHCSYFTKRALSIAFSRAGFYVDSIDEVFGNQYFWCVVERKNGNACDPWPQVDRLSEEARELAKNESLQVWRWRSKLRSLRSEGPVAIWGAGAKGVTFANLVDSYRELISCVVDLNHSKQGTWVPGTAHPIVPFQDLKNRNVANAIIMNPNYLEENKLLLEQAGIDTNLVCEV